MTALRRLVLRTRGWPVLAPLYRLCYRLAARAAALGLKLVLGRRLSALYLRRGLTAGGWTPGVSDIDLLAVLDPGAEEPALLRRLWSAYGALKRPLPMLGELQAASRGQLELFARRGGLRAAELGRWRPLIGAEPPAAGAGGAGPCLQEAAASYLALLDAYFAWRDGAPEERFKVAKAFLDTVRCARAAEAGAPAPASRVQELEELRSRNEAALVACLEDPDLLRPELAFKLVHVAFGVLDALCPPPAGAPSPAPPADAAGPDDEAWRRRLHALAAPGMPRAGVFCDTLFRWYVVVDGRPEPAELRRLLDEMRAWRRGEQPLPSSGWLVSYGILRALAASPHLETPFFRLALGPAGGAFWSKPASAAPLWRGHQRWRWKVDPAGIAPAAAAERRALARQTAAELALTLPLFGLSGWGGSADYRLFYLYSRVLPLALYARDGLERDPHDLDALVEACAALLPEEPLDSLRRELALPAGKAADPAASFYEHWPTLARVLARAQGELAH